MVVPPTARELIEAAKIASDLFRQTARIEDAYPRTLAKEKTRKALRDRAEQSFALALEALEIVKARRLAYWSGEPCKFLEGDEANAVNAALAAMDGKEHDAR